MPCRSRITVSEQTSLMALPENQDDLIRYYTFTESDLALIRQRRGDSNRLGFTVQLCLLRNPGYALTGDKVLPDQLIQWVARQVSAESDSWAKYGLRDETRREHFLELVAYSGLSAFGLPHYRLLVHELADLAIQTDKGMVLAGQALEMLRKHHVIQPSLTVVERACAEALTYADRRIYRALTESLTEQHKHSLENLLKIKPESNITLLVWLRQSPLKANSRYILEYIERLKTFQSLAFPDGIGRDVHQNRLLKLAPEGGQMTPRNIRKFESDRRYAALVALSLEGSATVTDEIIDLHDRILVKLFNTAK